MKKSVNCDIQHTFTWFEAFCSKTNFNIFVYSVIFNMPVCYVENKLLIFSFGFSCFQYSPLKVQMAVIIYLNKKGSHKDSFQRNIYF